MMTKEQVCGYMDRIKKTMATYPGNTEIISVDVRPLISEYPEIHVSNNIEEIAKRSGATMTAEPLTGMLPDENVQWYRYSVISADDVCTFFLEKQPLAGDKLSERCTE